MAERGSRVEYRMARLFLALAERLGRERGDHLEIPLVLSRQEIADMVGTTQETAIRVMSRWAKENLVSTTDTGLNGRPWCTMTLRTRASISPVFMLLLSVL